MSTATITEDRVPQRLTFDDLGIERQLEAREYWSTSAPVSFEQWIALDTGRRLFDLVNGMLEERPLVQLDHDQLETWIVRLIGQFLDEYPLGMVHGSRRALRISNIGGRLPDICFVSNDRLEHETQMAITGSPNLVIEIRSPNDRQAYMRELESDYRSIGVDEIVFIDPMLKQIRILRRDGDEYVDDIVVEGWLELNCLLPLRFKAEWFWATPRPKILDALAEAGVSLEQTRAQSA